VKHNIGNSGGGEYLIYKLKVLLIKWPFAVTEPYCYIDIIILFNLISFSITH